MPDILIEFGCLIKLLNDQREPGDDSVEFGTSEPTGWRMFAASLGSPFGCGIVVTSTNRLKSERLKSSTGSSLVVPSEKATA